MRAWYPVPEPWASDRDAPVLGTTAGPLAVRVSDTELTARNKEASNADIHAVDLGLEVGGRIVMLGLRPAWEAQEGHVAGRRPRKGGRRVMRSGENRSRVGPFRIWGCPGWERSRWRLPPPLEKVPGCGHEEDTNHYGRHGATGDGGGLGGGG